MRPIDKSNPFTTPIQIRFTEKQLEEIDSVAEEQQLSRAEVIRLACSAGVVALKKLGEEGLVKAVAKVLTK
ncbi:MAG: hypothetical protein RRY13_07595 [Akkermansia sp.]